MRLSHFISVISFAENRLIPTEVRKEALELQKLLEFEDEGGEGDYFFLIYIRIQFYLLAYVNTFSDIIQVLVLIWMMSTSGQEWKTPKLWSQHPENPALDSRCLPKYVKSYYSYLTVRIKCLVVWLLVGLFCLNSNLMFCSCCRNDVRETFFQRLWFIYLAFYFFSRFAGNEADVSRGPAYEQRKPWS